MANVILLLITLGPQLSVAAQTVSISETDLPRFVREKNKNVSGASSLKEAAQARTGHLVRSFLPKLEMQVGGEIFKTGRYSTDSQPYGSLEAKINLFRGGKDSLEEDIRKAQVIGSDAISQKTFAAELLEARRVFWKIVFNREMISILKSALQQNDKHLEMANRKIQRGLSSETDRLDFQINRSQIGEDIESLTHELLLLQISFSALLGMDEDTLFRTPDSIPHLHDSELLTSEFNPTLHPEVTSLKTNQEISNYQMMQAKRWWIPSLDIYGGHFLYTLRDRDYLNQNDRYDSVVGVRLTFEIFDSLHSNANAKSFFLQSMGFEQQALQRGRSIDAQIKVAKEDLKHDHELVHFAEERIDQGKKYLSRTLDEYNRGVKNSIDVLGASQKYVGFQRQYAERRRNYQFTKCNILSLLSQ